MGAAPGGLAECCPNLSSSGHRGRRPFHTPRPFPSAPWHRRTLRGRLIVSVPRRRHFPRARAPAVGARGFAAKVGPVLAAPGRGVRAPVGAGRSVCTRGTRVRHPSVTRPSVRHLSITYWSIYRLCLSTNHLSPVIYCLLTNHLLAAGRFKPRVGRFANAARADLYTRLGCRALCPGLPAAGFLEDTVGCEREEVSPFLPQLLSGSPQSQRGPLLQPRLLRAPQTPRVSPGPRSAAPCARRPGSWSRWSRARRRGPALPPAALGTGPRAHLPETPCAVSSL